MQYETLTDLLNNEAAAYEYFYALSPDMQTRLQQKRNIRDLRQLKQAAADMAAHDRPAAFCRTVPCTHPSRGVPSPRRMGGRISTPVTRAGRVVRPYGTGRRGRRALRCCYSVMIFRITRSVSRMPCAARTPTFRMVSSTSSPRIPSPGRKLLPPAYMS